MKCFTCDEQCDELIETEEHGRVCAECLDHFEANDAMRDEELRQMNEAFDAEFGEEEDEPS